MTELDTAVIPARSPRGGTMGNNPDAVTIIARPHMFRSDLIIKEIPYGQRINEIIDDLDLESEALQARVLVDDHVVEKAYWHRVKPKAGHRLTVRVLPQGGGGQGKDGALRMVAMMGVMAAASLAAFAVGIVAPYLLPSVLMGMVPLLQAGTMVVGIYAGSVGVLALISPASSRLIGAE